MPKSKEMTISDLAIMVKKGFDEVHGKFDEVHQKMDLEFGAIRSDIRDIKGTLGPLVRSMASLENDYSNLRIRVSYLEQKVGMEY